MQEESTMLFTNLRVHRWRFPQEKIGE